MHVNTCTYVHVHVHVCDPGPSLSTRMYSVYVRTQDMHNIILELVSMGRVCGVALCIYGRAIWALKALRSLPEFNYIYM